jgi:hypothetical protein
VVIIDQEEIKIMSAKWRMKKIKEIFSWIFDKIAEFLGRHDIGPPYI